MLAVVNSLVQTEIGPYMIEGSQIKASVETGSSSAPQTLTIVVEGSDREECINLANSISANAANGATEIFESLQELNEEDLADLEVLNTSADIASVLSGSLLQNVLGSGRTFEFCSFMVSNAIDAERDSPGVFTLGVIGLAGGLFLAALVFIAADMANPRIKSASELEEFFKIPVLCDGVDADCSDQLWANICFSFHGKPESLCLIPLREKEAVVCAEALDISIRKTGDESVIEAVQGDSCPRPSGNCDGVLLYCCTPLSEGAGALYCSNTADVTIIPISKWSDSRKDLESTLKKLSLARANVVGFALLAVQE